MKKILILATAAFLISGSSFSIDNVKRKPKQKKQTVQKAKAAARIKARLLRFNWLP